MTLTDVLIAIARHFPSSRWEVAETDKYDTATLPLEPLQVRVVLFKIAHAHFQPGDVTITLHSGNHLLKMFGTPSITSSGKVTKISKNTEQADKAANELCNDLLGMAAAILTVTEPPDSPQNP